MTRSMLFVPGDSARKLDKALASEADALVLDLEDAVAPEHKADARAQVVRALEGERHGKDLWVRVNAIETGLLLTDLAAIVAHRPAGILVPKCSGRKTLEPIACYLDALETAAGVPLGSTRILAIVTETAQSIFELGHYAGVTPRLWGMTWGAEDLAADVGSLGNRDPATGGYSEPFRLVRSLCLLAAAAAGVRPIDSVCVDLHDDAALRQEAEDGRRDGFTAKLAIHPRHLAAIHAAFTPTDAQIDWARRVLAAFAAAPDAGALQLDGKMIDQPHIRLATRLLAAR